MSMSTHVVGFKPADDKWQKMKTVRDACVAAELPIPDEVDQFFNREAPDEAGVKVSEKDLPVREWRDDWRSGFELDVTKLDPDIKVIRFYNAW